MKITKVDQLLGLIQIQLTQKVNLDKDVSFYYQTTSERRLITVTDSASFTPGQTAALVRKILETMLIAMTPSARNEFIASINTIYRNYEALRDHLDMEYLAKRDTLFDHIRGDSADWKSAITLFGKPQAIKAKTAIARSTASRKIPESASTSEQTSLLTSESHSLYDETPETRFAATYSPGPFRTKVCITI